jgi:hypothetical protein
MKHIRKFNESIGRNVENNIKSVRLKDNELYIVYEEGHYYPVGTFKDLNNFVNCFNQRLEEVGLEKNSSITIDSVDNYITFSTIFDDNSDGDYKFYYEIIDIDTYYYRGIYGSGLPTFYQGQGSIKPN